MRFKEGDKVRVREKKDLRQVTRTMDKQREQYAGEVLTIAEILGSNYITEETEVWWTDEMLEPIEDPLADKILERNNKPTFEMYEEEELVNHPAHYTQGSMETIEKIKLLLTEEEYTGFLKGNIIKYDDRMNHKGDAENDLRKSKWYAERLRSSYYGDYNLNE